MLLHSSVSNICVHMCWWKQEMVISKGCMMDIHQQSMVSLRPMMWSAHGYSETKVRRYTQQSTANNRHVTWHEIDVDKMLGVCSMFVALFLLEHIFKLNVLWFLLVNLLVVSIVVKSCWFSNYEHAPLSERISLLIIIHIIHIWSLVPTQWSFCAPTTPVVGCNMVYPDTPSRCIEIISWLQICAEFLDMWKDNFFLPLVPILPYYSG